ncbi:hypothetical protein BJX62DRAFT_217627 [Aspergillus germanicus]
MRAFSTQSLGLLAALSSFATASIGTTTITSVYTTTTVTTSTSTVADCAVSGSAEITCSDGFYNTYGAVWEEYCAASVSGGSLILSSTGLSLRACMSACAVRSTCSGVYWDATAKICYLLAGELTITPGGPYQGAYRYSPDYQPCESTIVATVVDTVTSLVVSTYSITPTPTPDPIVSSSSTFTSSTSSPPASPISLPSSSRPVIPSSPPTLPASSHTPTPSPPPSSVATITSSTSTEAGSGATQIPDGEDEDCTEDEDDSEDIETATSATDPGDTQTTSSQTLPPTTTVPMTTSTITMTEIHTLTACPSFVRDCPASEQTTYTTTETIDIYTTICPVTATETSLPDVPITTQAPLPHPAEVTTISTVYQTSVHTMTACPPLVTDCPASQQTTYLSTETLPSYATVTLIPVEVPIATATDVPEDEGETDPGSNAEETDGQFATISPGQQAPPTFTTSVAPGPAADASPYSQEQTSTGTLSAVGSEFTGAASVLGRQRAHGQIAVVLFGLAAVALI